ncbi:alpha/beta hydrolase [Actinomadura rudentiformis]|nr:alpha/beta hydrolase [Actinomadura rudentiformis]
MSTELGRYGLTLATWRGCSVLVGLMTSLLLTGCLGGEEGKRVTSDAPLNEQCGSVPGEAKRVALQAADRARLGAAVVGSQQAQVGVVLAYGASQTLCDWLEQAQLLASATQSRVLIIDRRGVGSSQGAGNLSKLPSDLVTGAQWLRANGAKKIVLMGSSMGSAAALVAADKAGPRTAVHPQNPQSPGLQPPACAVVAISPVSAIEDDHGNRVDVSKVSSVPGAAWLVFEEGNADVRAATERVATQLRQAKAPNVKLKTVKGSDHSIALVSKHADARDFVEAAVRSCRTDP